jgi:hypothetical protein
MRGSHRKGVLRLGDHDRVVAVILPGQGTLFTISRSPPHHRIGGSRLRLTDHAAPGCRGSRRAPGAQVSARLPAVLRSVAGRPSSRSRSVTATSSLPCAVPRSGATRGRHLDHDLRLSRSISCSNGTR